MLLMHPFASFLAKAAFLDGLFWQIWPDLPLYSWHRSCSLFGMGVSSPELEALHRLALALPADLVFLSSESARF